jgi:hypothetical protein
VARDRKKASKYLIWKYRDLPRDEHTRSLALRDWNTYWENEQLKIASYEEITEEVVKFFKYTLHRYLYASNAAAILARLRYEEDLPLPKAPTTCRLEGFFRSVRSAEKTQLCFRSIASLKAFLGLLILYHNTVGTGSGCLYDLVGAPRPDPRWNPFADFPACKKTIHPLRKKLGTPLRSTKTQYGQQHSHQILDPYSSQLLDLPNDTGSPPSEAPLIF